MNSISKDLINQLRLQGYRITDEGCITDNSLLKNKLLLNSVKDRVLGISHAIYADACTEDKYWLQDNYRIIVDDPEEQYPDVFFDANDDINQVQVGIIPTAENNTFPTIYINSSRLYIPEINIDVGVLADVERIYIQLQAGINHACLYFETESIPRPFVLIDKINIAFHGAAADVGINISGSQTDSAQDVNIRDFIVSGLSNQDNTIASLHYAQIYNLFVDGTLENSQGLEIHRFSPLSKWTPSPIRTVQACDLPQLTFSYDNYADGIVVRMQESATVSLPYNLSNLYFLLTSPQSDIVVNLECTHYERVCIAIADVKKKGKITLHIKSTHPKVNIKELIIYGDVEQKSELCVYIDPALTSERFAFSSTQNEDAPIINVRRTLEVNRMFLEAPGIAVEAPLTRLVLKYQLSRHQGVIKCFWYDKKTTKVSRFDHKENSDFILNKPDIKLKIAQREFE